MQEGFSLTFPDAGEFVATKNVSTTHETETQFVFSGLSNTVALFEGWLDSGGKDGTADSRMSTVSIGVGAGVHRITLRFTVAEGWDDTWGDSDPGDSARSKMQTLNRAVTEDAPTTNNPATLEVGEYSESGKYNPIDVIIEGSSLPFDAAEESSSFTGTLRLLDSVDFQEAIDARLNDEG